MLLYCFSSCNSNSLRTCLEQVKIAPNVVKSIMLNGTIRGIPLDTLLSALADINRVIHNIVARPAGYSLWHVQSDTISDYRCLIQGEWRDQVSYDHIHRHLEFRKVLDKHHEVISQTRKGRFIADLNILSRHVSGIFGLHGCLNYR
ncbi:MAG: hypothetical protein IPL46_21930 [Saprospiraceae bacterium]|nr:hypothetical protein [Saprospiraceae bacterium]